MDKKATCQLCGEPMPAGEEMFNYHGYSGPCPKPPPLLLAENEPGGIPSPPDPAAKPSAAQDGEIVDAIRRRYAGDHNIVTLFEILDRRNGAVVTAGWQARVAWLSDDNDRLRTLVREAFDAADGDIRRSQEPNSIMAETGWYKRAKEALGLT